VRRSWKEIVETATEDQIRESYIFHKRTLLNPLMLVLVWSWKLFARIFLRLHCFGIEKLPQKLPFIVCPNHDSFLDGPLVCAIMPKRVIYSIFILGYSDYWQSAFSKRLAQVFRIVPIDPNVNLVRAMQAGAVGLKQGSPLLIFPEGTRSIDGRVAEFKKGAAILAVELGIPIVPVGIRGTFEAWPRGGSFRLHPVEFHFGDPIDPKAFKGSADPYSALTATQKEQVKSLAGE
jgi:long-chain acyl-CoA synthetase